MILLYLFIAVIHEISGEFGCLNNHHVKNWWIMYKQPRDWKYMYMDSRTHPKIATPFTNAPDMLKNDFNPFFVTIKQIWGDAEKMDDIVFFAYNDQVGKDKLAECSEKNNDDIIYQYCKNIQNKAHSKGVLAIDFSQDPLQAFWIIHSVPLFPAINLNTPEKNTNKYLFRRTKTPTYAQSFVCLSLIGNDVHKALQQLKVMNMVPYARRCGLNTKWENRLDILDNNRFCKIDPAFGDFEGGKKISKSKTLIRNGWFHISKPPSANIRLTDWIAINHKQNMKWLTFPKTKNTNKIDNQQYGEIQVMNVRYVKVGEWIDPKGKEMNDWKNSHSHAKIGVSFPGQNNRYMLCIGDLNRHKSQMSRGGGFACTMRDRIAWMEFEQWFGIETEEYKQKSGSKKGKRRSTHQLYKGTD
eukprot:364090_1